MDTRDFVAKHGIEMSAKRIADRPDSDTLDMPKGSTHWRCTFKYKGKQMTVYYSQGPAHTSAPDTANVLDCVASDAACVNENTFETWTRDLGFDSDSRKAEKVYKACRRADRKLRAFLHDKECALASAPYSVLLYQTERL